MAIAERCWDAGYSVRVHDGPAGAVSLFLADPFGREIALIGRTTTPEFARAPAFSDMALKHEFVSAVADDATSAARGKA